MPECLWVKFNGDEMQKMNIPAGVLYLKKYAVMLLLCR